MFAKASAVLIPGGLNSDKGIVDAARVSFAKRSEDYTADQNRKLIEYLYKHNHWSPFGHPRITFPIAIKPETCYKLCMGGNLAGFQIAGSGVNGSLWAWHENVHHFDYGVANWIQWHMYQLFPIAAPLLFKEPSSNVISGSPPFRPIQVSDLDDNRTLDEIVRLMSASFHMKTSIFIARQYVKHQVGLCWNEVSRRYVDDTPEFYEIEHFRSRPDGSAKQGSGGNVSPQLQRSAHMSYELCCGYTLQGYTHLLEMGVAPEQARAVLPVATMTEWIWTGSLEAWARVCKLRLDLHAQKEAREVAEQIDAELSKHYGRAWAYLKRKVSA